MVTQESELIANFFDACTMQHLFMQDTYFLRWPEDDKDGTDYVLQFACHTSLITGQMIEDQLVKKGQIPKLEDRNDEVMKEK